MPTPRVSILIPNFNNGRASSKDGTTDLIGDLLVSIERTLRDDPTPFELFAHDDESTDDSIQTLRQWSRKTWPDGRPFLTLIESPHEGFISRANNRVYRQTRGEYLVRLDGDITIETPNWVSRICRTFDDGPPDLGILAPKQLDPRGHVHAFGDMILSPLGYHHVAAGLPRYHESVSRTIEVDHAMGCFYCCRRSMYDEIGGYDEKCLRGETEDLTMMARHAGWRCWAVPDVEFVHRHSLRGRRQSQYDDGQRIRDDLNYFEQKWGFSRLAPDLDVVRRRHRGTLLVGNATAFGPRTTSSPSNDEWNLHRAGDADACRRANTAAALASQLAQQAGVGGRILLADASTAAAHLAATRSDVAAVCFDEDDATQTDATPGVTVVRSLDNGRRSLAVEDASCAVVVLWHTLGQSENPAGLLADAARALVDGGLLLIAEPTTPGESKFNSTGHGFAPTNLNIHLAASAFWQSLNPPTAAVPPMPMHAVMRRVARPTAANPVTQRQAA
jgi:GT2 family glycosyltransferase